MQLNFIGYSGISYLIFIGSLTVGFDQSNYTLRWTKFTVYFNL